MRCGPDPDLFLAAAAELLARADELGVRGLPRAR
jgi:hypothetical protein